MLSRAIMAPRDLIIDTPEAQKMALFFDQIIIWGLERTKFDDETQKRFSAEFSFLREQGIALNCGINIPIMPVFIKKDGSYYDPRDDCDILLPMGMTDGLNKHSDDETHADRMVRHISEQILYNEYPVVAHAKAQNLEVKGIDLNVKQDHYFNAIEITLNQIPLPPENIPWVDLIQFKNDEENITKLRSLRLWLQKSASKDNPSIILKEEIEHLLYEYQKYMKIQHKKYTTGVISSLVTSSPEIVGSLLSFNFGAAIKSLFNFRGHQLGIQEAEMAAPGREVSYISKVNDFILK
jgi:hypothetical protein